MNPDYNANEQVPKGIASLGIVLQIMRDFDLQYEVASITMQNVFATQFEIETYLPVTLTKCKALGEETFFTTGIGTFMSESALGQMNPIIVKSDTDLAMIIAFEMKEDAALFTLQFLT
jgi:hypothetical protein